MKPSARLFSVVALIALSFGLPDKKIATPLGINQASFTSAIDSANWNSQRWCYEHIGSYKYEKAAWQHIKLEFYRNRKDGLVYYLGCEAGHGPVFHQLDFDIDFASYQSFGQYAVDKHTVFYYFYMSDGKKIIPLDSADRKTFKAFGTTQYARDKRFIYWKGDVIPGADLATFSVIDFHPAKRIPPLAHDKNHVYVWDKILKDTAEIEGLKDFLNKK